MKKVAKILFLVLLLVAAFFVYKNFFGAKNEQNLMTTKVYRGNLLTSVVANGEVQAQDLVDVGAQVGGQIKKLYVKLGDKVKKGDMIAEIDAETKENEISKLNAQRVIYEANLNAAKIAVEIAKTQYDREQKLYKAKATSKESLENAKNSYVLKEAEVKQIEAQLEQNTIELDTANTELGYAQIKAPLDGTIVSVPVKEGQTVNANQTTPTIVKIADLTKLEITMEITEGDITKIKPGMEVEYSILSNLNETRRAQISSIDPALTTLSDGSYDKTSGSASSSAVYYYAKILVDNSDDFLKIGMTTENTIIIDERKDILLVPYSAVEARGGQKSVRVLKGSHNIEMRQISTGITDNINIEVTEGLKEGDTIVISEGAATVSDSKKRGGMMGPGPM